jgi:two-component system, response regulator PdtaR
MTVLSVLVIEDDAMIGILLTEILEDLGYNVSAVAATEADAVAKATRHKPGLMIVDEHLREGSGSSAVSRIRLAGPVPCVFIGDVPAHPSRPDTRALQKPFFQADLIRAIQQVVGDSDTSATHRVSSPGVAFDR